jgi:hypothetical protein
MHILDSTWETYETARRAAEQEYARIEQLAWSARHAAVVAAALECDRARHTISVPSFHDAHDFTNLSSR